MRLILRDYIATLKEEKELESLLENILIMNDYKNIISPQKGVTQDGVDFYAEKNGEIYLFVLKQQNIDRNNWDSGKNSVRQTLNEIVDVYIPERIKDSSKKINIILCSNGTMMQNVENKWNGYIKRETTSNQKYDFWDINELVRFTEQLLVNEYLFEGDVRSYLRKTLYFFEEDEGLKYYEELLSHLIRIIQSNKTKRKKYQKFLIIYNLITKMCISYSIKENLKIAVNMAEKSLLKFWTYIAEYNLYQKELEGKTLILLLEEYEVCGDKYLSDVKKISKYEPSFPIYNGLEHRLIAYEVIGIVATYTFYLHYYYSVLEIPKKRVIAFEKDDSNYNRIQNALNVLIELLNHNSAILYPPYDLHAIELNIIIYILKEYNKEGVANIVEAILSSMLSKINISKYYPVEGENYDKALDIEFSQEDVEECKATLLITNLLEWLKVFGRNEEINIAIEHLNKKFPDISYNTIQIDKENEIDYFRGDIQKSVIGFTIDFDKKVEKDMMLLYKNYKLEDYNFYKYSSLPLLFIAARHYRLPLPSNLIYKYLRG